jgi:hypothetical protein
LFDHEVQELRDALITAGLLQDGTAT